MTATRAVEILDEYTRRLEQISDTSRYNSDAGTRLYEGWLADALVDDRMQEYPFIAIQPAQERRQSKTSAGQLLLAIEFDIVLVRRVKEGVARELLLDTDDLRAVLSEPSNIDFLNGLATHAEVGDAVYNIPEGGGGVAWVAITVTADFSRTIT